MYEAITEITKRYDICPFLCPWDVTNDQLIETPVKIILRQTR